MQRYSHYVDSFCLKAHFPTSRFSCQIIRSPVSCRLSEFVMRQHSSKYWIYAIGSNTPQKSVYIWKDESKRDEWKKNKSKKESNKNIVYVQRISFLTLLSSLKRIFSFLLKLSVAPMWKPSSIFLQFYPFFFWSMHVCQWHRVIVICAYVVQTYLVHRWYWFRLRAIYGLVSKRHSTTSDYDRYDEIASEHILLCTYIHIFIFAYSNSFFLSLFSDNFFPYPFLFVRFL